MAEPLHGKTAEFRRLGLYSGIKSFSELERRIEALTDERQRGDAFEVFAEAYLATQRVGMAKHVWPDKMIPTSIRKRLRLSARDVGADGVIEMVSGKCRAYQVKFRSRRAPLTWSDTATFLGVTDHCDDRLLFTNSEDVSKVAEQRKEFSSIRGTDLDSLTAEDFDAIRNWLDGRPIVRKKSVPRRYQQQTLDAILPVLKRKQQDRATAVMACGTGKTFVALWVAEAIAKRTVLVLVPSLALLRQTLREWVKNTTWEPFDYLCVCSDPTVSQGDDELVMRPTELEFSVSTNPEQVREFLAHSFAGMKIVFSTYQSADVIARGMPRNLRFDIGIFDEAHKTAGREGAKFSFALKDENLPIHKRLFLTATPRHYDLRKRDKEGEPVEVYSMNRPEIYGPVVHTLSFAEAAKQKIICNYKVVISVVTSDMLCDAACANSRRAGGRQPPDNSNPTKRPTTQDRPRANAHRLASSVVGSMVDGNFQQAMRHGTVLINGDEVKAQQVANQIALAQAVAEHHLKKIFTFHRNVASARSFTSEGSEGIGTHLPDFAALHVNGAMSTAARDSLMTEFKAARQAVMSNARCLTEGIDVPTVDMVAFLTPKRSKVDIVQAVGRAMRNAPGKTTGYILVPLYVEQAAGESLDAAVARAEFDEVWAVLQAMQEQDEVLAEIIQVMGTEKGRTKGFDDSRFREKVTVLGPTIKLEQLRSAITTSCVENLGAVWDERFGELQNFKIQHGHCNVPIAWPSNPKLGQWVSHQRRAKMQRQLSQTRIARLDALGFVWDAFDKAWEEMFVALDAFKMTHGDCNVPQDWPDNPQLATWVTNQRQAKKRDRLSHERVVRLEALGFRWNPHSARWEEMFAALQDYQKKCSHCNVSRDSPDNPRLGVWIKNQRRAKQQNELSSERIAQLDALGFVWDPLDELWEEMFAVLEAYKKKHGDCNVPQRWAANPQLGTWVGEQRTTKRRSQLRPDRVARMEALGFIWDTLKAAWNEMFAALQDFKSKHGHCNVPAAWPNNPELATWTSEQRKLRKKGQLSPERAEQLEALGLVWDSLNKAWEEMFAALVEYRTKYGHCNVPKRWPDSPPLGNWVHNQRTAKLKRRLSQDRIARLEALGFVWDALNMAWEEKFVALEEYKTANGDCNVPQDWPDNPQLGTWVAEQRASKRQNQLSPERVTQLEALGLCWEPLNKVWDEKFAELQNFRSKHGHCNVPSRWTDNPQLATWVNNQRQLRKRGRLSRERIARLEAFGFAWKQ